jgi:phage tail-like protein
MSNYVRIDNMTDSRHLLTLTGPDATSIFELPLGITTLGREAGQALVLADQMVSRRHAQIERTADACTITDLGSANGTQVNNAVIPRQTPQPLSPGAEIHIGPFRIVYERAAVAAPSAAPKPQIPKPATPPAATPPAQPPVQLPPPPDPVRPPTPPDDPLLDLLPRHSVRLLDYLPGIYQGDDFTSRFLALFEAVLLPIEWNIDNFDLFLAPDTAPTAFLPWLSGWFALTFDDTWSEAQRRTLIAEAHQLYARLGTKWALSRVLEIYTGQAPEIIDQAENLEPFTFIVRLKRRRGHPSEELITNLIDAYKPAHTSYQLQWTK